MSLYFIILVVKTVNAVVVVTILMIPYAKLCVPNVVKNINNKVFNLMSRTNETRMACNVNGMAWHGTEWHVTCKCKCGLDASVCNNKQRSNNDKYWCECKELIDKSVCDKGFI